MANANRTSSAPLPDWWQREKQKRNVRILVFLLLLLVLIAYFYYENALGITGSVTGITGDTANTIAFVRQDDTGNSAICYIRADGTELRPLTDPTDKSRKADPVWTVDGQSLLYASDLADGKVMQIYILGAGKPKQLTVGTGNKSLPAVTPDRRAAVFLSQGAVKTVNLNGTDLYQVMPQPRSTSGADSEGNKANAISADVDPIQGPFLSCGFSSDGTGIAGVQDASGEIDAALRGSQIVCDQIAMAIPPGATRAVPLDQGHEVCFSWEPNGRRIACGFTELEAKVSSNGPAKQLVSGIRIWSFDNPTAPTAKNLFAGIGYSIEPKNIAWSPDGRNMAFDAWRLNKDGSRAPAGMIVISVPDVAATAGGVIVTADQMISVRYMVAAAPDSVPQHPRWSPDGVRILYELSRKGGKHDLCVINADGTNRLNLTNGAGDNTEGTWAPSHPGGG